MEGHVFPDQEQLIQFLRRLKEVFDVCDEDADGFIRVEHLVDLGLQFGQGDKDKDKMAKSVSCTECERLTETIRQLQKKNETLQQTRESEQFIDSAAANIQGLVLDQKHFNSSQDLELHVTRRKGKSSRKSVKRAPTLTPPLELSLQNRYDALAPNEMCDNTLTTLNPGRPIKSLVVLRQSKMQAIAPKPLLDPGPEKTMLTPHLRDQELTEISPNPTSDQPDTILIGDSITKHVRMAKTEKSNSV
ncbi:hypothetical protein ABVT39_011255 [Epinephelus coioides]